MSDPLVAEIKKQLAELDQKRHKLQKMLELAEGGRPQASDGHAAKPKQAGAKGKRKPGNLHDALKSILAQNPAAQLKDIYQQLQGMGWPLNGKNPKMTIYSSLSRHPELFLKTSQGWRLKSKNA